MSDAAVATATSAAPPPAVHANAWHNADGFSFRDVIDLINPLQHIPIISSIYRWATGDRPGEVTKIAGDALLGGPIGAAIGLVGAMFEDKQGHDVGERVMSALFGPGADGKETKLAAAAPTPTSPAPATAAAVQPPTEAKPDHPPMPLFGGIALPQGPAPQAGPSPASAVRDFTARTTTLERQITAGTRPAPAAAAPAMTAPVPLVVPAGALPAGAPGTGTALAPAAAPAAPIDVSRKMMDALDKYMRLEQERKADKQKQDDPTPALDLAL